MGEEKEDKFASLMKLCKPTASQESKLQNCPMARESEIFADSNADPVSSSSAPTSSEPTGIVMVSLPDSSSSIDQSTGHDDELEFHTPPEQRFSSSEDQPVDCVVEEPTAVDIGCTGGGVGTDDSGEGNSGSGFVELKKNKVPDGGSTENSVLKKARVSEDLDLELEGGNEFVGKNETILIEISSDSESEEFDEKTERTNMAVDSPIEKSMDNGGIAEKGEVPENGESNGGSKNGDVQMDGLDEMFVEISKNCKSGKVSESDAVKVTGGEKAHKNDDGKGRPDSAKNAEEIEKFKYVPSAAVVGRRGKDRVGGAGVSVGGKRELPPSIKGKENNARGEEVVGNARTKNGLLMDLLEVLKVKKVVGVGDCNEDVDFLETAKRQGLTFPKPRWWPPEGFEE
ncbi:Microtubule-associated protein 70-3 [Abeliophyllum distichum]|uniref:Microtubule-associated protein 70-3 n=1 Tax=Abeliophyllum distichum TaxID=126358 RepID=A0ABD1UJJ6_9LAMI